MQNIGQGQTLISIAEAAELLQVSPRTVARLIADGQLYAPKIRRRRLVSTASIDGLISTETAPTLVTE